jgi:hypothetical protein
MKTLLFFGLFGWIAEVVWTAVYDFVSGTHRAEGDSNARVKSPPAVRWRLEGKTYLWMFPVYGLGGVLFVRVHAAIAGWSWPLRGLIYCVGCFAVEAAAGWILKLLTKRIPWDYSFARWSALGGAIRLDYAPVWFAFGLILERVEVLVKAISNQL